MLGLITGNDSKLTKFLFGKSESWALNLNADAQCGLKIPRKISWHLVQFKHLLTLLGCLTVGELGYGQR